MNKSDNFGPEKHMKRVILHTYDNLAQGFPKVRVSFFSGQNCPKNYFILKNSHFAIGDIGMFFNGNIISDGSCIRK